MNLVLHLKFSPVSCSRECGKQGIFHLHYEGSSEQPDYVKKHMERAQLWKFQLTFKDGQKIEARVSCL